MLRLDELMIDIYYWSSLYGIVTSVQPVTLLKLDKQRDFDSVFFESIIRSTFYVDIDQLAVALLE